jgi:hypothetical protein
LLRGFDLHCIAAPRPLLVAAVSDVPSKQTTWPFSSDEDGDLTSLIRDNNEVIDLTLFDDIDFTDQDHTGNGTAFPSASPAPSPPASPAPASPPASPAPPPPSPTPKKNKKNYKKRRRDTAAVSCDTAFLAVGTDNDSDDDPAAAAAAAPSVSPAVLRRRRRQSGAPRRLRYLTNKNAELKARALHLRCELTQAESRARDLEAQNKAHVQFYEQQATRLGFTETKCAALAQYVSVLSAHHGLAIHPALISVCAGSARSAPVA